ncbi:hypothetical protein E2C01_023761 [Portunus trituberculatus]|uniref:Uncharacterized protein n=1 Tax=Portunus trituberculatus TaxID=210409 RepID=A0A5B7ECH3_PORTR|nr:hypothetical protein [Portunus trituberculatus]
MFLINRADPLVPPITSPSLGTLPAQLHTAPHTPRLPPPHPHPSPALPRDPRSLWWQWDDGETLPSRHPTLPPPHTATNL